MESNAHSKVAPECCKGDAVCKNCNAPAVKSCSGYTSGRQRFDIVLTALCDFIPFDSIIPHP